MPVKHSLKLLSQDKVELTATILRRAKEFVESISPINTYQTNHLQIDAYTHSCAALKVEQIKLARLGPRVTALDKGKAVDIVTLQNRLKEKDVPPEVSSLEFIRDIVTAVPTSANIRYYANIVAEKSTLRKLIRLMGEIENNCYAGKESLEVILEDTEKQVFELVQKRNTGESVPIRKVVMNALQRIEAASKNDGNITGVATGFFDLDVMTSGMQPADLVLIAARPSMGKTAFVLNIAQHVAFRLNETVAIFSLEMSKEQLVNRMLALESRVDSQHIRTGLLSDQEWAQLVESADEIGKSSLIIDDTPGISIAELRSKCRKFKLEHNLGLVIIDYLQLMTGNRKSESRQQEVSEISRSLKSLARELNVPVLALSQLSRAVEQRPDHRPMLSDLRESGAIEQDADVVMFLHREGYYASANSTEDGDSEDVVNNSVSTDTVADNANSSETSDATEDAETTEEPVEEPTEVPEESVTEPTPVPEPQAIYTYTDLSATMYATQTVNVRNLPSTDGEKIGSLAANQEVIVTGQCNETGWYKFELDGQTAFVSNSYLSTEKVEVQQSTGGNSGGGGNSWAAQFGVTLPFTATLQVATEGITHHLLWNHPTSFDPDTNLICHFGDGTQVTISDFATYRGCPMAYVTLPDGTGGWALFYDGAGCYFTW